MKGIFNLLEGILINAATTDFLYHIVIMAIFGFLVQLINYMGKR